MLLAGISAMAWWYASKRNDEEEPTPPESDPLALWGSHSVSEKRPSNTSGLSRL